jgi:hypothetical protein
VTLARPVPEGGQGRIRIDKTDRDAKSYLEDADGVITFDRSLGIRRNAVVLPVGYELIGANHPVQMEIEDDSRVRVSFLNPGPAGVPFRVRARRSASSRLFCSAPAGGSAPEYDLLLKGGTGVGVGGSAGGLVHGAGCAGAVHRPGRFLERDYLLTGPRYLSNQARVSLINSVLGGMWSVS